MFYFFIEEKLFLPLNILNKFQFLFVFIYHLVLYYLFLFKVLHDESVFTIS